MGRTIELKWNCRDCDQKDILGRNKKCPSCGSPREKGEMKMGGLGSSDYDSRTGRNKASTVTDAELLKLSVAGPDWFCSHCSSGNFGEGSRCSSCGAARYGTAEEDHPDFRDDHKRIKGADQRLTEAMDRDPRPPEPSTDVRGTWARIQEEEWGDSKSYRPPPPPPSYVVGNRPWTETYRPHFIGGSILTFVVLLIAFTVWAMQTHEVHGTVTGMTWDRLVQVERWTDTNARLWKHQTSEVSEISPRNGTGERAGLDLLLASCRQEHFSDERYISGHHEECEDIYRTERESYSCTKSERYVCGETCRDGGNGFAHCSDKYCSRSVPDTCSRSKKVFDHKSCHDVKEYSTRPIYKEKCDYMTQEWRASGSYPTAGKGKDFTWGTEPTGDEVRRFYSATYTVTTSYTDGGTVEKHDIVSDISRDSRLAAEQEASSYLSWDIGDPVKLDINNLGGVHDAAHLKVEK